MIDTIAYNQHIRMGTLFYLRSYSQRRSVRMGPLTLFCWSNRIVGVVSYSGYNIEEAIELIVNNESLGGDVGWCAGCRGHPKIACDQLVEP